MANGRIQLSVNCAAQVILTGSVPASGMEIVAGGKETLVVLSESALLSLIRAHTHGWETLALARRPSAKDDPVEDEQDYGSYPPFSGESIPAGDERDTGWGP